MKRRKIIPGPVLMVISILGIAAFQLYWLNQNYVREKKALKAETEGLFQYTVMELQTAKLNLDGVKWEKKDSTGDVRIVMSIDDNRKRERVKPNREVISTINIIRDKLNDSLKGEGKKGMVISMNKASLSFDKDSLKFNRAIPGPGDHFFNFLYGVDSLQDSLRITEIDSAYAIALHKEKIYIPYSIVKSDTVNSSAERDFSEVTVGFAHPVNYKLMPGNTIPYLIKQILQLILFSILLLGITILSFVLLYKNLLKQRRLAELKNEFISNITHELKTPIATVGVAIEALKNFNAMDDPERTKEYLDISQNELQRLGLLVDKVLKLSMFENKEMELKYETVDLKGVVDEVVGSLRLQLEKIKAVVTVAQEGSMILQGDRLHLLSVVFNLLDNSLKYSTGKPSIRVEMKEKENTIELTVADNGIGIAPEYKDKVFDKFFRIPHGNTHNAKGYGLGLSYVAQVIQKHRGTIEVESQPGNGSKFTITLPKATA